MNKRKVFLTGLLVIASVVTTACSIVSATVTKPSVVISSPASNSQFHEGEQVAVQSTSTDTAGISRVELSVDGNVVRTDQSPHPQVSYTVIQNWTATAGTHTITVRSIDRANNSSQPAAVTVLVLASVGTPTATPAAGTLTPTAGARACLNASFVTDVTVPDGTAVAGGQVFNKIWRVRNNGSCAWGINDELVFVSGEPMTNSTVVSVPNTAPGATADLLVPMSAPLTLGLHSGTWRLRSTNGVFFGTVLTSSVNVVVTAPPPLTCAFNPVIHGFGASSTSITPGESTSLNWGFVEGAQTAEIDNGIGGVPTPGSVTVSPGSTTTYTLTAICGGRVSTAHITINVAAPAATNTSAPAPTNTPTQPPPTSTTAPTHTPTPTP